MRERESKNGDMNNINKHAHTHNRIQENKNLKKGNGGSRSAFTSRTLMRQFFITSALYMIFRTVLTNRINTHQVNARKNLHVTRSILSYCCQL